MARIKIIDLALKTGYTQGDFHNSNILVNITERGHFGRFLGNILIIDFGYARKIDKENMDIIRSSYAAGDFIKCLDVIYKFPRSDGRAPSMFHPLYYGWLVDKYNSARNIPGPTIDNFHGNLKRYVDAENDAIQLRIESNIARREHLRLLNPKANYQDTVPHLPLSKSIRKKLYSGYEPKLAQPEVVEHVPEPIHGPMHGPADRPFFPEEYPFQEMSPYPNEPKYGPVNRPYRKGGYTRKKSNFNYI